MNRNETTTREVTEGDATQASIGEFLWAVKDATAALLGLSERSSVRGTPCALLPRCAQFSLGKHTLALHPASLFGDGTRSSLCVPA